jgi:hypothetical protein
VIKYHHRHSSRRHNVKAKLSRAFILAMVGMLVLPLVASAGNLEDFVKNLSLEAKADSSGFKYRLHSEFEVSGTKVDMVLSNVSDPADAYMVLRVGVVTGKTIEAVLDVYKANKGKGWGVIAKKLGIKPGSAEFHALKAKGKPEKKSKGNKSGKGKGRK